MKRVPLGSGLLLAGVAALGVLVAAVWFGFLDVSADFFTRLNVVLLILLFVFAVLGGAFVGMLLTHRLLGNREFTPLERIIMETSAEVKSLGRRLAALEDALLKEPPKMR